MVRTTFTRFADGPILSVRARVGLQGAILALYVALGTWLTWASGPFVNFGLDDSSLYRHEPITEVILDKPPPPPSSPTHSHQDEGASGAAGKRAEADPIAAPAARLPIPAPTAAPVAGSGSDTRSGASAGGEGTGGASSGTGTGAGGLGQGGGGHYVATKPVKIAGDLVEADYPKAGRAKRLGTAVIVVLTVGTDGQVSACRVHQPSGDPEADAVTCKLALERFRFHPALDQNGDPVESVFGWQQRFFWK